MVFEGSKLIATPERQEADPVSMRRNRLIMQIEKQVSFVVAHNQGRKSRGRWWSFDAANKPILAIKYGRVPLELAKGKHAIACEDMEEVVAALTKAKAAVLAGTFDAQLASISAGVRARFKKRQ